MLKREITYTDLDGDEVTDVYYFNISKREMIEMEVEYEQGFGKLINQIIEAKKSKELIELFKKIVMMAYGKKSEDGKRFIKTDALRQEFAESLAYDELFMELATDDVKAAEFMRGILPPDVVAESAKAELAEKSAKKLGTKAPS